ncbi:MAG: TonB family protein [Terriglobales bacterium]|jgi:periplasmic protein TonB
MGYQALLFCPDEKLARVVSQVFSELDFTIEPVHEPFAAVKKLMTQRYDAIVVDCENEQNASLLFKSARNSSSNQSSLAIALVLGQAGVAKSYRIGANLVLTKPINVEQAKGTLRVARGLLRKNADAAGTSAAAPATPARTAPASAGTFQPANRGAAAIPSSPISSEFEIEDPSAAATPAIAASVQVEAEPELIPAHAAQTEPMIAAEPPEEWQPAALDVTENDAVSNSNNVAANIAAVSGPAQNSRSAFTSTRGSAAAPAPAKEVTAPPAKGNKVAASEPAAPSHGTAANSMAGYVGNAPSFSAFAEKDSGGSGGKKKVLIAAVVLLALAALGYVSYGKFGKPSTTPAPRPISAPSTPQSSAQPAPAPAPSTSAADPAVSATPAPASKTTAAIPLDKPSAATGNSPVPRIALDPDSGTKKPNSAPILVKSTPAKTKTKSQSEESAPQLPSPLADASAPDSNLSGLMAVSPSLPKPTLETVKVSQGVSQGLLIKRVQPKYPPSALAVHTEGAVEIDATINKEGNVTNVKVLSGNAVLAHAAVEAVRQWRYKPYYLDGQPVEIETQITVNFKAN